MRSISIQLLAAAALSSPIGWASGTHADARPDPRASTARARSSGPAVSVASLLDKGVVHSGFLVGTAASDGGTVVLVEVSLDGGAFQPAVGTTNWKFKFPTSTNGWRDNSLHTIDVRATDGAGNASSTATLTVRKGANLDVNGDGFADMLVGAPSAESERGRVYLFYSSSDGSGIPSTANANNTRDPMVKIIRGQGGAGPQQFGAATAMGDVNGDGYADLVVGAPASLDGAGHIYVFYAIELDFGSALVVVNNALGTSTQLQGDDDRLLGLGASVAVGDVDGDGVADVVAGAPGTPATPEGEPGRVYFFHAVPASPDYPEQGLIPPGVWGANASIIGENAGTGFGTSVAIGDVNGDGFSDVIVGEILFAGTRGQAYVFHAAADGRGIPTSFTDELGAPATTGAAADTHIIGEETSQLGASLAVGDMNSDGFIDLAAGGPTFDDSGAPRGRVYLFYSAGANGIPTNPVIGANGTVLLEHVIGGEIGAGPQLFGTSIAVADVNGDGTADLIVGAPASLNGAGASYVFHSTPGTGLTQGNAINARATGTLINGDFENHVTLGFGASVGAGDVNGDGVMDVFGGALGTSTLAGRAFVFHAFAGDGIPDGINGTVRILDANTTLVGAAGALFGFSIAR